MAEQQTGPERSLLNLGSSDGGQGASDPTAVVFAWWVFFIRLRTAVPHVRAHVVFGALTQEHDGFHSLSYTHTQTSQMLRMAGFVSKSLSLDRVKAGAQWRE